MNDVNNVLKLWAEASKDYYGHTLLDTGGLSYTFGLVNAVVDLEDKLVEEYKVNSHFLEGAEDFYTNSADYVPAPMDEHLARELFDYIRKGSKVSDVYEGDRNEYLKGAEWWMDNCGAEEAPTDGGTK